MSAFTGAGSLFRNWRRDRKERQKQEKNEHLEQALVKGSSDVQKTYDDDFRRLGRKFARGDGMTSPISTSPLLANAMAFLVEIGRSALAEQLIKLQGTVISVLTGSTPISALVYPAHDLLSDTSIAVRLRSLSALTDQYQRMSQAAPLRAPPATRCIRNCDGTMSVRSVRTIAAPFLDVWQCSTCSWNTVPLQWRGHHFCFRKYLEYFHEKADQTKGEGGGYRCVLCNFKPSHFSFALSNHLQNAHGLNWSEEARSNKDGCPYHRLVAYLGAGGAKQTPN